MSNKSSDTLSVLPLRGKVVFPDTTAQFDIVGVTSIAAMTKAATKNKIFLALAQKDAKAQPETEEGFYKTGTVCSVEKVTAMPGSSVRVAIKGLYRAEVTKLWFEDGMFYATFREFPTPNGGAAAEEAYFNVARELVKEIANYGETRFSKEIIKILDDCTQADEYANVVANYANVPFETKQDILSSENTVEKLKKTVTVLNEALEKANLQRKINSAVRQSMDKSQREYYLREQLKAIHTELSDGADEHDELEERIKNKNLPEEVQKKTLKEFKRMVAMQPSSPDYNVYRTYIDWILDLPWGELSKDEIDVKAARKVLDDDHFGLDKVKQRVVEYLAVLKLTGTLNAPILCLVGPPGVGKTSIAASVARALGRKFVRMSLGGVKDEAEIRGHRKTYVGALPGRIIVGLKNAGSSNPVFLLDEVDKISSDMRGDPASALLEVLDPEQNATFRDRYLEVPYDLSKVLFITTANSLDTIPRPLLDRMEIVELSSYTEYEKLEIAKRYLVPKKIKANGLKSGQVCFDDLALKEIITGYTSEAGVRNLERQIDAICRKCAVKYAEGEKDASEITADKVEELLGARKYKRDKNAADGDEVGAATGLAWTAVGGVTLTVEVSLMRGKGEVLLTGKLGDVMKESAKAAFSYIRANAEKYNLENTEFEKLDIHVHVPDGATPKDGPSAGITIACAMLSALTKKPVKKSVAMTGEITIRGKVLPIGGLKEKAIAAYKASVADVIIPADNQKDLEEIPEEVKNGLNFIPVTEASAVFNTAICWG